LIEIDASVGRFLAGHKALGRRVIFVRGALRGQAGSDAGGFHAGYLVQFRKQAFGELLLALAVLVDIRWQRNLCGQHALRFETNIDLLEAPESADQEAGAGEEDKGERSFGDDQGATEVVR
jgi:hypothetical protein